MPLSNEDKFLSKIARDIYNTYPYDGKYISQSSSKKEDLLKDYPNAIINSLGYWTHGINVDSSATNRKLGSDIARNITGRGLYGKDLSKEDVSINIYAFKKVQELNKIIELSFAIGDEIVDGISYQKIVNIAKDFLMISVVLKN